MSHLKVSNLANTARLLDSQRPTPVVNMKIPFISLFFILVEGLLVLGSCPSLYVTLGILHVSRASQGLAKQFYCPLSAAHRVSDSQISGGNPSCLSLTVS